MSAISHKDYRTFLLEELERRCEKNHRYSLRAFAKSLGMSSARLSEVLNRKSGLSRAAAAQIATHLALNKGESELFCDLVESEHARSPAKREFAKLKLQKYAQSPLRQLHMDAFSVIADWYCFAVLELIKMEDFDSDPVWIAQALGITAVEARTALERFERLGLIEQKNGKLVTTGNFSIDPGEIPSESVKRFHQAILEKASAALPTQPVQRRDFSAMTLGFDTRQLPEAKAMIKDFRRAFDERFGRVQNPDQVYCLAVQLFNLTPALEEMR